MGRQEGANQKLMSQIQKKMLKNKTIEQIAEDLDEPIEKIAFLYNQLKEQATIL